MTTETSPRLGLDYVMAAQAQKHVTVNESFRILDSLVQACVQSRVTDEQPASPGEGELYILTPARSGEHWSLMAEQNLAAFRDGEWSEIPAFEGLMVWISDEARFGFFDGSAWGDVAATFDSLQNLDLLGIGTTADAANPFSAKLNASLWTARTAGEGGTGDLRYTLNKESEADVLSLLFQSGFSGRAELGLIGDDDLLLKMSADGTNWFELLHISPTRVSVPASEGLSVAAINGTAPGQRRNLIINGDFSIAQRGLSFNSPAAGTCTLDRWLFVSGGGMAADISQEDFTLGQTDIPGAPAHFMRWALTGTASGNPWIEQRIENARSLPVGDATLSFYARASRSVAMISRLRRNFGSGGSTTDQIAQDSIALTTDWTRFEVPVAVTSLTGKTLGAGHYLSLEFYLLGGETSVDIDIADVQLECGPIASRFERLSEAENLRLCQRYFVKTWPQGTDPGSASEAGSLAGATSGPSATAIFDWRFPVEMRGSPSLTLYSPATAASGKIDAAGTDLAGTPLAISSNTASFQSAPHSGLVLARAHATANAEL
ncbi:DUF2793 domain-containing protein [Hyphobacterium sp. CCMP332]|uniref:DUF2793 domain-containing protein n=1 Tax=Hyphobacterium sp. CCMP332 TaxID=2749086 RepID=UPI00164F6BCE|nr:DUF2793 domain-containing protein [Hyphobacterium sp. CCMP332]QNL18472.1 DUF2793 domain-containing protein [Hyphobacterium sp. CCMP332]